MAITTTPKLGLPQWGLGSDSPSRVAFNGAFASIDTLAAVDPGDAGTTTLPVTNVVNGRYAQTVDGNYRKLYRRVTTGWQQVGGNTWDQTFYNRADGALATTAAARIISHPGLASPSLTENWDGSSIRGARQAIGDINSGLPGALHVGDISTAVDLTVRGRVWALTAGNGGRGFVATAHAAAAGNLFTARDASGSEPWLIDSAGRMRSQAPSAFGAATLTTNVPFASAPGTSDLTGADFYTAAGKPATRWFRGAGDQIGSILPDAISFGKASWTGASITLTAPTLALIGATAVTGTLSSSGAATFSGAQVNGSLGVTGTASMAGVNAGAVTATSMVSSGQARGATVVSDGQFTAHGGLVSTGTSGSGALVTTRPPVVVSGSAQQSLRQSHISTRTINPNIGMGVSETSIDVGFTMPEDGWLRLEAAVLIKSDAGASGSIEPAQGFLTFDLRNSGGLIQAGTDHPVMTTNDDTSRQLQGQVEYTLVDIYSSRITAGSYTLRIRHSRTSVLVPYFMRAKFVFTPVVLHSTS